MKKECGPQGDLFVTELSTLQRFVDLERVTLFVAELSVGGLFADNSIR